MERAKKVLIYALILLPLALAFKNFFYLSNPLVWGDAPYFYLENLKELFHIPYIWDIRNSNFGSPQFLTLWLYIPTFMLGLLHKIFGLNHEVVIRLVFYLPFLISGILGILLLLTRFKFSGLAKSFGIVLYILNTYSLVLIDGGQIGVMLSYGLFPLVLLSLLKFLDNGSLRNFLITLAGHFMIFNTDLRIALILLMFEIIWWVIFIDKEKIKKIIKVLAVYSIVLGLCSFWIVPFLAGLKQPASGIFLGPSNFIELYHSFYLFQPHFPNNDFGNLSKTPIYFIFIPLVLFLGLLEKNTRTLKLAILFLLFVFLSKGSNPFSGEIYNFFVNNVPLGSAFRDSSKFYIPAILIASILVANTTDFIRSSFKKFKSLWICVIYLTLILTIYPALIGNLSGILGKKPNTQDFTEISQLIRTQNSSFRTLWFNERPSLGYADWNHPSISANLLFQERPFASMIDGDYDLFGFLHAGQISQWYELLGIKYIFYPPYEREKSLSEKELAERKIFENFISKIPKLQKINLQVSFPAYETKNPQPKIFAQEKVLFVVGGEEIYSKFFALINFSLEKAGIVFLESCKFNPETIFKLKTESFGLALTGDKNDLLLPFFCSKLISPSSAQVKQWAVNNSAEYLNWKSQLLERGVRSYDYDFNKGMAYSTKENEQLKFKINVPETQNYYLPVRFLTATESSGLKVKYGNDERVLKSSSAHKLEWAILGPVALKKGGTLITLTNKGGLVALNTLGLIPQDIYDEKKSEIDEKLKTLTVLNTNDNTELERWFSLRSIKADYLQINPVKYQVQVPKGAAWLVFSERFDEGWNLQSDSSNKRPLPFYSIISGFYVGDIPYGYYEIYFQPQKRVDLGILLSMLVFSGVCFGVILHIISRGKEYEIIKKYIRSFKD